MSKDGHAKEAIRSLKANKAGRLTFLPMESVKGGGVTVPGQVRQHAGYLGIGASSRSLLPQYQGIFNYLLGRVAVVDNMDSAIALSKIAGNGIRFVTLDGEIINAGGAITGGRYKNASANLLARKSENRRACGTGRKRRKEAYQKGHASKSGAPSPSGGNFRINFRRWKRNADKGTRNLRAPGEDCGGEPGKIFVMSSRPGTKREKGALVYRT